MVDAAAELDRRVEQFESAWGAEAPPELNAFLPAADASHYLPTVAELIRVDLEFRRRRGEAARLERYRSAFPALFADTSVVRELAFEEYRLRLAAREPTHPREYAARYGIDTADWPPPRSASSVPTHVLSEPVSAPAQYPRIGETVLDFRLVSELGRGAFARVYLAEQIGLAGRRVAVKVSAKFGAAEPETLARLQHTHIVPVYSTHQAGPFQIVVMPFLGALTLADFLDDVRARGALPGSGQILADTLAAHRSKTVPASADHPESLAGEAPARPTPTNIAARTLARFTYPEAVLWIGAELADALAHAHERGILHRDIKPANVLLTDDGRPMLLDFNLAADAARPGARVGGTPAYMAPEQLQRLRGAAADVDGRADVFSLGVVLFEALAGRHPFPLPTEKQGDSVAELLRLRDTPPPDLATLNTAVSPSAAAIIRKCLEPDPARRYASAKELAEDLERQLAHQSLLHVREPSPREQFRKWRRRHPRLASTGSVAALAAVLVVLLGGAVYARHERVKQLERESADVQARRVAEETFRTFQLEARDAVPLLVVYGHDPKKRAEGERRVRDLLGRYDVLDDADWVDRPAAALLADADRDALRAQAAEMLMILARVGANREVARPPGPARDEAVKALRTLVERAEAAHRSDAARKAYLDGSALVGRGKYLEAVRLLEDATACDPRQFWAWFNLGVARLGLGSDADAEGCFNACVSLEPDFAPGYFNRGLARLNRKQHAAAEADFTTVLRLKPGTTDALVNRALAWLARDRKEDAEADVTTAIDLGGGRDAAVLPPGGYP